MSGAEFREKGIAAAKARRTDEARQYLLQAIRLDPQDALAWLYLASVTSDKKERLVCLQKVLEIDPENELGRKAVQAMGIDPEQLLALSKKPRREADAPPPAPPTPAFIDDAPGADSTDDEDDIDPNASPYDLDDDIDPNASPYDDFDDDIDAEPDDNPYSGYVPAFSAPIEPTATRQPDDEPAPAGGRGAYPPPVDQSRPGVPIPDLAYLEGALLRAEQVAERYLRAPADDGIRWTPKTRNRAGDGDLLRLRLQIYGAIAGAFIVFLGVAGVLIANNPEAQRVVLNIRTATLTPTATRTPSITPGLTETPTATIDFTANPTFTPSPTFNLTFTPVSVLGVRTPRPTEPYLPGRLEGGVINALDLLNRGNVGDAIATLEVERRLVSNRFDPNPYYISALALAEAGELNRAFAVMDDAEDRLENISGSDGPIFKAVVDLAFAELHLRRALELLANGNRDDASAELASVRERAADTLEFDPRYSRAHVLIAQSQALEGDYAEAIRTLTAAQLVPGLADNVALVVELAAVHLQRGRDLRSAGDDSAATDALEEALYQAALALFLNAYEERAHQIRTEAALALGRPGDAVLYTQTYRIAHPNSPQAFRLLGEARVAEGNTDLALEAYTVALEQGDQPGALVDILLSRGDLYLSQRRYELAQADYSLAFELRPVESIRALRWRAAYLAGDFDTVEADSLALLGTGIVPDDEIRLVQAQVLLDRLAFDPDSPPDRAVAQRAYDLLSEVDVQEALQPVRDEYLALAAYLIEDYETALESIRAALDAQETGTRRFLSGRIQEAISENLSAAIRDYQWVLAWNTVYDFSFASQAETRLQAVATRIVETQAAATAVIVTATAEAELALTQTAAPPPEDEADDAGGEG